MNLLVLHSELGVLQGGGETFSRNLFTAFTERGHRVAAAFVADPRGRYPKPLPPMIEPIPIPGRWSRKLGQPLLSSLGRRFPPGSRIRTNWDRAQEAICWRTIRWHNQRFQQRVECEFARRWNDFDAVYVQSNVLLASAIASHHPTLLMLPGPVDPDFGPLLRKVHAVCAHDDGLVQLRAFLGERALEIPLGLDVQLFSPGPDSLRSALGWTDQHLVAGYVGRLTRLKGVDLLAAAFHQVSQATADARLLIVGSGEEEDNIRSVLAKELARGIVHIEPAMDQYHLPNWYRAMDLLVMPSRYETMSNAVLEAMACGIPFLASDVGGNKMLGDSGAGWIFESDSITSLNAYFRSIINNPGEMKVRGELGRRCVQQRYSWARSAERLEQILTTHVRLQP
jgi:glycosyltransferase involved in cell wall biosynthesis